MRRCALSSSRLRQSGGRCHLLGLVSPGGVHSHQDHAAALAQLLADAAIPVCVHAFTDGRDTPPRSGARRPRPARRRAARRRDGRDRLRPLLRDGPRQAMGTRRAGLPGHRATARARASRCRGGDGGRLRPGRHRRVRRPRRDRRLRRNARRRRAAVLQLPCRPGAGDPGRTARSRLRRLPSPAAAALRRRTRDDAVQHRAGPLPRHPVPARAPGQPAGRGHGGGRAHPAPRRRDREIPARHLLPERRPRDALRRRGPHPGALAEGRDL